MARPSPRRSDARAASTVRATRQPGRSCGTATAEAWDLGAAGAPRPAELTGVHQPRWRGALGRVAPALLAGLECGVLVLGIGGRLAMRLIALASAQPPVFSIAATLEVLAAGAWRGAVGGTVYLALRRLAGRLSPWVGGLVTGLLLFAFAVITLRRSIRGQIAALDIGPLTAGLFGAVFVLYGLALPYVAARLSRVRGATTTPEV